MELLALLMVLILCAFILPHTPWGRELMPLRAAPPLDPGALAPGQVGRLSGQVSAPARRLEGPLSGRPAVWWRVRVLCSGAPPKVLAEESDRCDFLLQVGPRQIEVRASACSVRSRSDVHASTWAFGSPEGRERALLERNLLPLQDSLGLGLVYDLREEALVVGETIHLAGRLAEGEGGRLRLLPGEDGLIHVSDAAPENWDGGGPWPRLPWRHEQLPFARPPPDHLHRIGAHRL